jgi:hypothetical protein
MERIAEMTEKTTEYDIGQAVKAAGGIPIELSPCPELHLSVGGSEWLKLPSGEYINMSRVERVTFYPETYAYDPQDDKPAPPSVILDMGHRSARLLGADIAAIQAYLDGVVLT